MSEAKRKSNTPSRQAAGKLRVVTGKLRVWRGDECDRPDQPVDRSVTPDQPSDRSVRVQQPDAPFFPTPR